MKLITTELWPEHDSSPTRICSPLEAIQQANALAVSYIRQGRYTEAAGAIRSQFHTVRRALDPDAMDEVMELADTADRFLLSGETDRGEDCYRQAVHQSRIKHGPRQLRTLLLSIGWAAVLIEKGDDLAAEGLLLDAIGRLNRRCGAEHPFTRSAQLCFSASRGRVSVEESVAA